MTTKSKSAAPKSAAKSAAPKSAAKSAAKAGKPKTVKTPPNGIPGSPVTGKGTRPTLGQGDECLRLSRLSDGKVSSQQVRVLTALAWVTKSPHTDSAGRPAISRADLKELVGIGRDGLYSQSWLADLWEMQKEKLICIEDSDDEGRPRHMHSVTAKGRQLLERLRTLDKASK